MQTRLVQERASLKSQVDELKNTIDKLSAEVAVATNHKNVLEEKVKKLDDQLAHPYRFILLDALEHITDLISIVEEYLPYCIVHRFFYLSSHCVKCLMGTNLVIQHEFCGPISYEFQWCKWRGGSYIVAATHPRDIEILQEWNSVRYPYGKYGYVKLPKHELVVETIQHISSDGRESNKSSKVIFPAKTVFKYRFVPRRCYATHTDYRTLELIVQSDNYNLLKS